MLSGLYMPVAIAMMTAFISIIALTRVAESLRLVDHPQGRKQHVESTPVIGGIAITLSPAQPVLHSAVRLLIQIGIGCAIYFEGNLPFRC